MIDFIVEPSQSTPYVSVNSQEGVVAIEWKSFPENALKFYLPIIERVYKTFRSHGGEIRFDMSLKYFNTSSSKCLFNFLKMLKALEQKGNKILVNWYYEEDDEDMLENGEDYAEILEMNFNYVEVEWMTDSFLRQAV